MRSLRPARGHPISETGTGSYTPARFRRLKNKTQVFVYSEGENYRTRLTHSLEVAQIARSMARVLDLNEDLAEALALSHDLGHTPFGHAGEMALQACMAPYNGFDHNAQALRIVTKLEARYADFDGLNLTWETLEGLVKHNGPLTGPQSSGEPLPLAISEYVADHDLELDQFASLEAQIAAISDDIAYNTHDIDDGLRAGLFTAEQLVDVPLAGPVFEQVMSDYRGLERQRLVHEALRRMIGQMVDDVCAETRKRLEEVRPQTADDVRSAGRLLAGFSTDMAKADKGLKGFLFPNMYRHHKVTRATSKAKRVVADLFDLLFKEPNLLPLDWRSDLETGDPLKTARRVADYIAGMTDRFALEEHSRLFDPSYKP